MIKRLHKRHYKNNGGNKYFINCSNIQSNSIIPIEILKNKDDISVLYKKIEKILIENGDRYDKVLGSIHKIKNILNDYKVGDLNILLLDAKTCGSGLNLENTDVIILFHAMNKEMEQQIIGRAQRLGRNNQLVVYKILYESEF